MNKYLTYDCINCNKFSHCNNNDLICISKYNELIKSNKDVNYYFNKIVERR